MSLTIKISTDELNKAKGIDFFWELHNNRKESVSQLVFPSVHTDLIFVINGKFFVNEVNVEKPFISPVLSAWKTIKLTEGARVFGVRLKPNFLFQLIDHELSELKQKPNLMTDLVPDFLYRLLFEGIVDDNLCFEARVDNFKKIAIQPINSDRSSDNDTISIGLNLLKNNPCLTIKEIADHLGYSDRWIQNLFKVQVGLSPSKVTQILRFNKTIELLKQKPIVNLTHISYEAGYYDQSHLIKEFRKFTSSTPKTYQKHMPDFIKIMNGF